MFLSLVGSPCGWRFLPSSNHSSGVRCRHCSETNLNFKDVSICIPQTWKPKSSQRWVRRKVHPAQQSHRSPAAVPAGEHNTAGVQQNLPGTLSQYPAAHEFATSQAEGGFLSNTPSRSFFLLIRPVVSWTHIRFQLPLYPTERNSTA